MDGVLRIGVLLLSVLAMVIMFVYLLPKWKKREKEENKIAKARRIVELTPQIRRFVATATGLLGLYTLALAIFPSLSVAMGIPYGHLLIQYGIPLLFDCIALMFFFVRINYTEEGFEYINAFGYKRKFRYDEVVRIIDNGGNVRVITTRKKIILFNVFSGVRDFTAYVKLQNSNVK